MLYTGSKNDSKGQCSIIQSSHLTAYDSAHNGDELTEIGGRHQLYCSLVAVQKSNDHPSLRGSRLGVMKERALARLQEPVTNIRRYHAHDS